jgi:hypothetical protein
MSPVASNLPPSTDPDGLAERFMEHWIRIFAFTTEAIVFCFSLPLAPSPFHLTDISAMRHALCSMPAHRKCLL